MANGKGDGAPLECARLSYMNDIEVLVGKERARFMVHTDIICSHAPFFDAALKRWKQDKDPMLLEHTIPEVFNTYLECIYTGKLTLRGGSSDFSNPVDAAFDRIIDVYILGDELGDLQTCNNLIDQLIYECGARDWYPAQRTACKAWLSAPIGSPLRRLFTTFYVQDLAPHALRSFLADCQLPVDFVCSLVTRFSEVTERGNGTKDLFTRSFNSPRCEYHQHDALHPVLKECNEPRRYRE
ncbi:hypothetical protein LTR86_000162 [Recurvomyces mirabilis]|nr:hypothetical protein LTR86_000162 [Recurvomyces mirabilis]